MISIQDKFTSWQGQDRALGEIVYERIDKHLAAILLKAYQGVDPTMVEVPQSVLETERRKFACVSRGEFSETFFEQQQAIIANYQRHHRFRRLPDGRLCSLCHGSGHCNDAGKQMA